MQQSVPDHLVSLRRDLHRHPEPAWREFYTTSRIVDELERIGVDQLYVGKAALGTEHGDLRLAVPDDDVLDEWFEQARAEGAREDVLEQTKGGYTGALAVLEKGDGPTIALRVDIDALPQRESDDPNHVPAAEGFRSEHEGAMHACGHDAHVTFGIGVLEQIKESDFSGTFKLFFQPAEEVIGGGKPMAKSGHLDDVDYLLGVHVGLDHPTGEVVAGIDGFLAVNHFNVEFTGLPAHAGAAPDEGHNAVQALATAIQNCYAIPRHQDGATRVNCGVVGGGTAANIIPESAFMHVEVRGRTTELMGYMKEKAVRVIESAADMYECDVEFTEIGEAPSAESDQSLVDIVNEVAGNSPLVSSTMERDTLGGSEDATFLMQEVQDNGGEAAYVCIGTSHPTGHHTATFDVEEESIDVAVDVLSKSILEIAARRP
ncbi:amidohydrolase [Haladaptatus sp. GCM10025707]|uniref:amidohydrolase n=1 Tax=unclassified Haladaptatus TaxID=2622732 RepID=UPI0023E8A44F|nr:MULTISPECIES: amidohydrolase [unclassified Haladaptatus]